MYMIAKENMALTKAQMPTTDLLTGVATPISFRCAYSPAGGCMSGADAGIWRGGGPT